MDSLEQQQQSAGVSTSVVICAYADRRHAAMRDSVGAVLHQLGPTDEVLVVIDHNDQLLARAQADFAVQGGTEPWRDARVRVISNLNPRGLSGARNTGVGTARGELVIFLDDDAIPRHGWLDELTAPFVDSAVIGVGGTAAPSWERPAPAWLPAEFLWVVGCSYRGLPETPTPIRNPIGANMAFRREILREAGGFTDGIGRVGRTPLGCEETELSIRASRLAGGSIMLSPAAVVDHLVTADRASLSYFVRRCWAEGISKAVISGLVGSDAALASERGYVVHTLSSGVLVGLRDGIRGDRGGFARAASIVGGFTVTAAGYLYGLANRDRFLRA